MAISLGKLANDSFFLPLCGDGFHRVKGGPAVGCTACVRNIPLQRNRAYCNGTGIPVSVRVYFGGTWNFDASWDEKGRAVNGPLPTDFIQYGKQWSYSNPTPLTLDMAKGSSQGSNSDLECSNRIGLARIGELGEFQACGSSFYSGTLATTFKEGYAYRHTGGVYDWPSLYAIWKLNTNSVNTFGCSPRIQFPQYSEYPVHAYMALSMHFTVIYDVGPWQYTDVRGTSISYYVYRSNPVKFDDDKNIILPLTFSLVTDVSNPTPKAPSSLTVDDAL